MTTEELSNSFDTLANSYGNSPQFGTLSPLTFDEFEKSVFLTEAQNQIVIELYSGRNDRQSSFEETEELRACLRNLIREAYPSVVIDVSPVRRQLFKLPSDLLFITQEEVVISDYNAGCLDGKTIPVIPVTHDSWNRVKNNPFRKHNKRKALRIDTGPETVQIISMFSIGAYHIKYLSRPAPILLINLGDDIKIEGYNKITECTLDSSVHWIILERAVQLALRSRGITINDNV